MAILRRKENKKHHQVHTEDVLKFGMDKACILGNIHFFYHLEKAELHEGFPYIPKEEFYQLLNELVSEGELQEVRS